MQNKRKVCWKWLLYPLTIIFVASNFPYFVFNCPWNWLWFYARWFIIAFILFTFRKEKND